MRKTAIQATKIKIKNNSREEGYTVAVTDRPAFFSEYRNAIYCIYL